MIFLLDNYDSFTYNLVQYLRELSADVVVKRDDKTTIDEIAALKPAAIVLSPGPGRPEDAGILVDTVKAFAGKIPMLGVCLGHQAIGLAFGAKGVHAARLMHGKTSQVTCNGKDIFAGLGPKPFTAMRYHSLALAKPLPGSLVCTATSEDGEVMGIRHATLPDVYGIQFHPESIMTPCGKRILRNFLEIAKKKGNSDSSNDAH